MTATANSCVFVRFDRIKRDNGRGVQRAADYAFRDDRNPRSRDKIDFVAGAIYPAGFAAHPRDFAKRVDATAALNRTHKKTAQTAAFVTLPLPNNITDNEALGLARSFISEIAPNHPVALAIHRDGTNLHAHCILCLRPFSDGRFGEKPHWLRASKDELFTRLRSAAAELLNHWLKHRPLIKRDARGRTFEQRFMPKRSPAAGAPQWPISARKRRLLSLQTQIPLHAHPAEERDRILAERRHAAIAGLIRKRNAVAKQRQLDVFLRPTPGLTPAAHSEIDRHIARAKERGTIADRPTATAGEKPAQHGEPRPQHRRPPAKDQR